MPNYVKNVLKFKNLTPEGKEFIVHMIAEIKPEFDTEKYLIDFNKIIPEPESEHDCPDEYKLKPTSAVAPEPGRSWFNWYDWRVAHWGTKWPPSEQYHIETKSNLTFVFTTAWTLPYPIIRKLRILGIDFEHRWADEDLGHNCGKITYKSEQDYWQEDWEGYAYKDPCAFARELWRKY